MSQGDVANLNIKKSMKDISYFLPDRANPVIHDIAIIKLDKFIHIVTCLLVLYIYIYIIIYIYL